MQHYLNICNMKGGEIQPVDVITFGSPCQDLSVAGRRAGLVGERSHLFYEAVRIIKEMREKTNGKYPRFAVWENVCGAFSSNKGQDFGAVLNALAKVAVQEAPDVPLPKKGWSRAGHLRDDMGGGWSLAWRTFDAQYWGVPQRRQRILLVADFGGNSAREILFKPKGLPRDFAAKPTEGEAPPSNATGSFRETSEYYEAYQYHGYRQTQQTGTLTAGQNNRVRGDTGLCVVYANGSYGGYTLGVGTLKARGDRMVNLACVSQENSAENQQPLQTFAKVASTLRAEAGAPKHMSDVVGRLVAQESPTYCIQGSMIGRSQKNESQGDGVNEEKSFTLTVADRHAVCYDGTQLELYENHRARCGYAGPLDVCPTITAHYGTGGDNIPYVRSPEAGEKKWRVRRLTPTECARLQGFPDNWASLPVVDDMSGEDYHFWGEVLEGWVALEGKPYKKKTKPQVISWYNKLHSDSSEYKMWGNGVALPVVRAVMRGVASQGARTMGSLFDGSGGFPLASLLEGISPLWVSEVQPYPIAVTRERFKYLRV